MVDGEAKRFVDEASDYMKVALAMLRRPAIPAWLILDSRHRQRYVFAMKPPIRTPQEWLDTNFVIKADSIRALAARCELNADALTATVDRFNRFARTGHDEDFHRGASTYDKYFADPSNRPNASLGTIEHPPFYAQALYPGDTSTCGGAITDPDARVLDENGAHIPGLYAVGNTAATTFGDKYPGAGASIGQSMVFGYRAANYVAVTLKQRVRT
jgi:3-oxosteroid 1-dehydrogenase